jgi:hypothetical protein
MTTTNTNEAAYANCYGYSDIIPYEIVRRVSDKTIEVREMKAEIDPTWKRDFIPGGFFGHTANNDSQKWMISSDETQPVIRIRKQKNGRWGKNGRFSLSNEPVRFYDFNF